MLDTLTYIWTNLECNRDDGFVVIPVQDRDRGGGWETARVFLTAEPDALATAKASIWASADGRTTHRNLGTTDPGATGTAAIEVAATPFLLVGISTVEGSNAKGTLTVCLSAASPASRDARDFGVLRDAFPD